MSVSHSLHSIESTSSSNTMPTNRLNEEQLDPSNILYNDHQNYQIIFTNDSRFFDTSLHLYKSYRKSGYIQSDNNKKSKKSLFPSSSNVLKPESNGYKHHVRSKSTGFRTNHEFDGYDATLKPPKNNDYLNQQRSDRISSNVRSPNQNSNNPYSNTSYQQGWPSPNHNDYNGDSSDDPDIIVTRL